MFFIIFRLTLEWVLRSTTNANVDDDVFSQLFELYANDEEDVHITILRIHFIYYYVKYTKYISAKEIYHNNFSISSLIILRDFFHLCRVCSLEARRFRFLQECPAIKEGTSVILISQFLHQHLEGFLFPENFGVYFVARKLNQSHSN